MSEKIETCTSCSPNYLLVISKYCKNDPKSIDFLRAHGVLPATVECPQCNNSCVLKEEDGHEWQCTHVRPAPKRKRRRCEFSVSDYEGTFLQKTQVEPWRLLVFVNQWLTKNWDPETLDGCLEFPKETADDLYLSCGQVLVNWFESFKPIGGPKVEVEIDENHILRTKDKNEKVPGEFWVFAGIERISKSKFIVPLPVQVGEKQDQQAKLAIIKKYILPGSIVYSDAQNACLKLEDHGYVHRVINHSREFVNHEKPQIHIQNVLRLWRDLKDRAKHLTSRPGYLKQYLARFMFLQSFEDKHLHHFFTEAAKLYPPTSNRVQVPQAVSTAEDNQIKGIQSPVTDNSVKLSLESPK